MEINCIHENIRKIREEKDKTQTEMAEAIGISRTSYVKIENGQTRLVSERLPDIARELGTSTETLVLGYAPEEKNPATLNEIRIAHERMSDLERRIEEKDKLICALETSVRSQAETIRSKDAIINLLSSRLDENQNARQSPPQEEQEEL